jgi:hypothetical protein
VGLAQVNRRTERLPRQKGSSRGIGTTFDPQISLEA